MIKTKANVIKILFIVLLSLLMMTGGIVFLCSEVSTPPSQMEEQVDEVKAATNNNYIRWTSYGANGQIGSNFGGYVWSGYAGAQNYRGGFGKTATQSTGTDSSSLTRIAGQSNRGIVFNTAVTNYKTGLRAGVLRIYSDGNLYAAVSLDSLSGTSAERGSINYKNDIYWDVYLYYTIAYTVTWSYWPTEYGSLLHYDKNSLVYRYDTSSGSGQWWWTVDGETQHGSPLLPSRTGYAFSGLQTSSGQKIINSSMGWAGYWNASTAYWAQLYDSWTPYTYEVTANANGGSIPSTSGWSGTGSTATKTVTFDSTYGTLPTPTRTGYTFGGWYTSSTGGTKIESSTTVKTASDHTIYAHWTVNNYNLKVDPASGSYNNSTGLTSITQNYGTSYTYLTPTKTGYNFDGWHTGQNYLSSAKTFDGSSTYVAVGRSPMYTSGISVAVRATMDSWSDFKTSNMRLVSCTESGGWNFEPNGEYVQFACYDSGVGYKSAKASIKWSDLATGYHTFTGTFDGEYARVYIDGKLYGTSAKFTSGKIGYHASNGIFIGAEAGSNATTPAGNYFKGTIDYVAISNSGTVSKPTSFTFPAYNSASTAQWTAKTFTLTFDGNGGGTPSPTSKTITYDSTYGTLASVSRTGYTFSGWWTAASGGSQITESTKVTVTANQTVYAHWTVNNYNLTLAPNSGYYESSNANRTYSGAYGSTSYFGAPLRTGYTFEGYTLSGAGTLSERKASSGFSSATLKSDANGAYYNYTFSGTRPSSDSWPSIQYPAYSFTAGKTYVLSLKIRVNSTTDGFSIRHASISNDWVCPMRGFSSSTSGWVDVTLEQTIGENYTRSGTSYTSSPRLEIYMNSTKATGSNGTTYKVDFDIRNIVVYEKISGQTAFSSISYTYGADAGTITANWQVKNYSVSIDPNGGTYSGSTAAKSVSGNYGTTTTISDPTRTGYTFAGWIATKTDLSTTWAQILYHDTVYGTSLFASSDDLASKVVNTTTKNSQFATLAKLNLTSYEFLLQYHHTLQTGSSMYAREYNRWKQTSNPATTSESVSGYQAVSISWNTNTNSSAFQGIAKSNYSGTFIDGTIGHSNWFYALGASEAWNGGIPGPSSAETNIVTLYLATDSSLSNFKPTATFKDADALGSDNKYYFKDESVTLKALWIVNSYTLTAKANSGSIKATTGWTGTGTTATKSVTYNTAYGTLPTVERTGYGFAGWYTAATGGTKVDANTKIGAANATIYAHWSINSYTLYANCNGGSAPSTLPTGWTANGTMPQRSVNYNDTYGTLPEPTRQGYIFAGWWTQASGGSEVYNGTRMGAADATIYAHWVESWVKYMSSDNPVIDQADGYYKIDSAERLARLAYLVNYNIDNGKWASYKYKQTADIDLSAHYWQPIGLETYPFCGTFDGTTFDIHNMKTYCESEYYYYYNTYLAQGLFGVGRSIKVLNVNIYDVNVKGNGAGIVAKWDKNTSDNKITNCRVTGKINGDNTGGILGDSYGDGVISKCENYADIYSEDSTSGGIVASNYSQNSFIVSECVNYGEIHASGDATGGGIIGICDVGTVENCVNYGDVGDYGDTGGIVGFAIKNVTIRNCINNADVIGAYEVGGILGGANNSVSISNCINIGSLTNEQGSVGGIVGENYGGQVSIESCFADCQVVIGEKVGAILGSTDTSDVTITYCGARITILTTIANVGAFYNADSGVTVTCNDSYSLVNNNGTKINRITATSSGMDGKFGMVSSIHDGLPVPLGIYHVSQYGTTKGIASTLKGSKYGCTTA